jgi:mannose-1-phosphate guanylyltransferase/phosphomannomutase
LRFHTEVGADATILLSRQTNLLDYGLVMTDDQGRVTRFIEKPAWDQVFTDNVNTGIYIVSPRVMSLVPENEFFDFARDLFPLMMGQNMRLFGMETGGYWCDVGDPSAYMKCCFDLIDGKAALALPPQGALPAGTQARRPFFIGEDCQIGEGCVIGPYAVLCVGSTVGRHCRVESSVLDGAHIGDFCSVEGAYVGQGTRLREGAVLREGAIVGDGCIVGACAELTASARVWPDKEIAQYSRVSGTVSGRRTADGVAFADGMITGFPQIDLTPETCMRLGACAASVIENSGEVGIAWHGGDAARIAALAFESGVCAAGVNAVTCDADFPAALAHVAASKRFPISVFVTRREDALQISFFDADGVPITRETQRKIESLTARGDAPLAETGRMGQSRHIGGTGELYAASATGTVSGGEPLRISVTCGGAAADMLRRALTAAGCAVSADIAPGVPNLSIDEDGFRLSAVDENGTPLPYGRLLGILLRLEALDGGKEAALPYCAPAALDEHAKELGLRLLRIGRDDGARELYARQLFTRDGVFAAVRLIGGMRIHKASLKDLAEQTPAFFERSHIVSVDGDRGRIMRELVNSHCDAELVEGFRARSGSGWVHVSPMAGRSALRVTAESASTEAAAELCDFYSHLAKNIDRQNGTNSIE